MLALTALVTMRSAQGSGLRHRGPFLFAGNAYPVIEYGMGKIDDEGIDKTILSASPSAYKLVEFYNTAPSSVQLRDKFVTVAKALTEHLVVFHENTRLETFAVSCEAHSELCEQENAVLELPLFVLLRPSNAVSAGQEEKLTISSQDLSKEAILRKIGIKDHLPALALDHANLMQQQDDIDHDDVPPVYFTTDNDRQSGTNYFIEQVKSIPQSSRTASELQNDIHLALDQAFSGLYRDSQEPLGQEQREVLKKFLNLLQRTIPRNWDVFRTIQLLLTQFQYVTKNPAYLTKILRTNLPKNLEYSPVCQQRNSTVLCGTWELLHAISVNVVEYNSEQADSKDRLPTLGVARVFRDYVQTFGMLDDSHNDELEKLGEMFVREFNLCEADSEDCHSQYYHLLHKDSTNSDVLDWIQLPLFLSELHNRLHLMVDDRKQWPNMHSCPKCWNMETGMWNEHSVYRYLQLEYTSKGESLSNHDKAQLLATPLPPRNFSSSIALMHSSMLGLAVALFVLRVYLTQQVKHRRFLNKWD